MRQSIQQRVAATTMLVLWILVPLLSLAHIALEEHTYCAEHQRLEEAGNSHGGRSTISAALGAETEVGPKADSSPASQRRTGSHERCALADDFTRDAQSPAHAFPSQAPQLAFSDAISINRAEVASNIALLHAAPKNSPPQPTA